MGGEAEAAAQGAARKAAEEAAAKTAAAEEGAATQQPAAATQQPAAPTQQPASAPAGCEDLEYFMIRVDEHEIGFAKEMDETARFQQKHRLALAGLSGGARAPRPWSEYRYRYAFSRNIVGEVQGPSKQPAYLYYDDAAKKWRWLLKYTYEGEKRHRYHYTIEPGLAVGMVTIEHAARGEGPNTACIVPLTKEQFFTIQGRIGKPVELSAAGAAASVSAAAVSAAAEAAAAVTPQQPEGAAAAAPAAPPAGWDPTFKDMITEAVARYNIVEIEAHVDLQKKRLAAAATAVENVHKEAKKQKTREATFACQLCETPAPKGDKYRRERRRWVENRIYRDLIDAMAQHMSSGNQPQYHFLKHLSVQKKASKTLTFRVATNKNAKVGWDADGVVRYIKEKGIHYEATDDGLAAEVDKLNDIKITDITCEDIRKVGLCHDCFQRDLDGKKRRGSLQRDLTKHSIWAKYGEDSEYE